MQGTSELPQIGTLIGDKYEVIRVLGQGGMGAVFEATHRLTGKNFAIKWLLPDLSDSEDAMQRFLREAQVAGRIDHPNVVQVYDLGQQGGSLYMVMELLQGESLHDLMSRKGKLEPTQVAAIMLPLLRGVAAAHAAGVVHRDLKPDNLFLCVGTGTGQSQPKVLDFGISKLGDHGGEVSARITKTGMVMGTPHYMPGEQLRAKEVDARTDVYALGVIMYQALSGKLPFPGDNYGDLVLQIVTGTPPPLQELVPELPAGLADIVARAMARLPEERYSQAEDLAHALEPYAEGASFNTGEHARPRVVTELEQAKTLASIPPSATPTLTPMVGESRSPDAQGQGRSVRGLWIAVAGAAAAAAALGAVALSLGGESQDEEGSWADAPTEPDGTTAVGGGAGGIAAGQDSPVGAGAVIPLDLKAGATAPAEAPTPAPDAAPDGPREPATAQGLADKAIPVPTKAAARPAPGETTKQTKRKPRKVTRRSKKPKKKRPTAPTGRVVPPAPSEKLGDRTVDMTLDDF